ncbi:hypothetical protein DFH11DRAFT_78411 [Phellopilus nigrolimitatus]|nr:hypothetical protein DFH11DRAFT_78411 [Phellopilus nigrolimitatus]
MRLDAMLAAAGALEGLNVDADVDIGPETEESTAESIAQELNYWEKVVFSFDMDRGPSDESADAETHGRSDGKDKGRQTGVPSPSGSGLGSASSSGAQHLNSQRRLNSQLPPQPPGQQQHNPQTGQFAQLAQIGGLDPYTLAYLAALSALSTSPPPGQHSSGPHVNPVDPLALLRQMQSPGLSNPFGPSGPGSFGQLPEMPQGLPPAPVPNPSRQPQSNNRQHRGQSPLSTIAAGQHWPPQLSSMSRFHPSLPPIDPSVAGQIQHLPSLMRQGVFPTSTQSPDAGPSSVSSSTRSPSETTPSPTTSRSPGGPLQAMDETAIAEDKRRRNTAASARFRIKKKHKTLSLERSVVELEGRAEDLEREAAELRRENGWLKEMLIMKGRGVRAAVAESQDEQDEDEQESDGKESNGSKGKDDGNGPSDAQNANASKGKGKGRAT